MSNWKAEEVRQLISSIPGCNIIEDSLSEDTVTNGFVVSVEGTAEKLYVRGFRTDGLSLTKEDNQEIEMVEVSTGYSDGDMPNDQALILAHAQIKAGLVGLGHTPVNSMDPYF